MVWDMFSLLQLHTNHSEGTAALLSPMWMILEDLCTKGSQSCLKWLAPVVLPAISTSSSSHTLKTPSETSVKLHVSGGVSPQGQRTM